MVVANLRKEADPDTVNAWPCSAAHNHALYYVYCQVGWLWYFSKSLKRKARWSHSTPIFAQLWSACLKVLRTLKIVQARSAKFKKARKQWSQIAGSSSFQQFPDFLQTPHMVIFALGLHFAHCHLRAAERALSKGREMTQKLQILWKFRFCVYPALFAKPVYTLAVAFVLSAQCFTTAWKAEWRIVMRMMRLLFE